MSKHEQDKAADERREFFRIDDSIRVNYRVIDASSVPVDIDERVSNDRFSVMTRLQGISQHLSAAFHRIEQRDPDVADYLKALDEKINLLGQSFLAEEKELLGQPSQSVNLSAGGLAMDVAEQLATGDRVEIKLLLLPSYTGVLAYGEVVAVDDNPQPDDGYPYHVRINFTLIRNIDQDALIRHILRRQGEMLRQRREERE
ncbi:MAG: PilZ domain-containing protein [Candidatus Thiodiazotropha sp.]|jgi:c-di-GMP-binding flagellar brake protein YcgR